jgi:hypothetical protein
MSESLQRPNAELSQQEKSVKRNLKKLLKLQSRRRKLEVRLKQALSRREYVLAAKTKADLLAFLQNQGEEPNLASTGRDEMYNGETLPAAQPQQQHRLHETARSFVESMYHRLNAHLQEDCSHLADGTTTTTSNQEASAVATLQKKSSAKIKEYQIVEARTLLQNMTKGRQQLGMFDNEAALRGYTRQKFIERAMLVVTSLGRLEEQDDCSVLLESASDDNNDNNVLAQQQQQRRVRQKIRERLRSVRSIASVGCGPGCDAVGVAGWLSAIGSLSSSLSTEEVSITPTPTLDYVVLLDWAMPQWERIVQPLRSVMVPAVVGKMVTSSCDVRSSLLHADNATALQLLSQSSSADDDQDSHNNRQLEVDIVITSYLLSETRDHWQAFFDDAVRLAAESTIFIFTDPTAWQLHIFRESNSDSMDFLWLDSSMKRLELQALEGRVGPAVLIGIKRG